MSNFYDAIILGAGINGVGIAKALALEGKSVCVIDKSDIAAGASSASSRLIHGGLRYIEYGGFSLVKEALHDQNYLLKHYPDLVHQRSFYLPIYAKRSRPAWMIYIGLWFYHFLSPQSPKSYQVPAHDFLCTFSNLSKEGLKKAFVYFDAQTHDSQLTERIAKEANEAGVDFRLNSEVVSIQTSLSYIDVKLKNITLQTPLLINATGAWIDQVNEKFHLPSRLEIEKLSGIHIEFEGLLTPHPMILQAQNKRIIFILPQESTTLVGTTERIETQSIDEIKIQEEDKEYLLTELNFYLKKALRKADIINTIIGVRPIIKSKLKPSKMSREYKLDLHYLGQNRLLHIYGGKLTTFHSLSQKVLKKLKG